MNVKGFILEDDQGREFVVVCEPPYKQLGGTFSLRGWQRRRLVPLQYTEGELQTIAGGVQAALQGLFKSLPSLLEQSHGISSAQATARSLQRSAKT